MNGQQKFYTFMIECTKDECKNEMSQLLKTAFDKQSKQTFQSLDVDNMMEATKVLLKEEKVEEVMNVMLNFKSQMK